MKLLDCPTPSRNGQKMGTKKKVAPFAVLVAATVASSLITLAPTAYAAHNCTTGFQSNGWAWGKCTSAYPGEERYRVNMLCQNIFTKASHLVNGTVVSVYETTPSTVTGCDWNESYYGDPWTQNVY